MEILRFEQVPESAPKRKKSSRGFLALGLVAALFGISTAFASSTIDINGTANNVSLGQGIATVAGCDGGISVTPNKGVTGLKLDNGAAPKFVLSNIVLEDVDTNPAGYTTPKSQGCYGKDLQVQVFKKAASAGVPATQLSCTDLGAASTGLVDIEDTTSSHNLDSKCISGSIYFRVWSTAGSTVQPPNSLTATYTISLTDGSADFDYITVVSTENIVY